MLFVCFVCQLVDYHSALIDGLAAFQKGDVKTAEFYAHLGKMYDGATEGPSMATPGHREDAVAMSAGGGTWQSAPSPLYTGHVLVAGGGDDCGCGGGTNGASPSRTPWLARTTTDWAQAMPRRPCVRLEKEVGY